MFFALWFGVSPIDFLISFVITIPFILTALTFHEVSHGFVANWLGDHTAKSMGRLSLNPISHLSRAGTLAFLIIGVGFAKPVPVNPYALNMDPRKGMAVVAAAGPLSNLLIAAIFSVPFRLDLISSDDPLESSSIFMVAISFIILINLILAIFNMLPIPPFDGYRIVVGVLPREQAISFTKVEKYFPAILVGFVAIIMFTNIWSFIVGNGVNFFSTIFLGQDIY